VPVGEIRITFWLPKLAPRAVHSPSRPAPNNNKKSGPTGKRARAKERMALGLTMRCRTCSYQKRARKKSRKTGESRVEAETVAAVDPDALPEGEAVRTREALVVRFLDGSPTAPPSPARRNRCD